MGINELLGTMWHVPVFLCIGGFFIKDKELCSPKVFIAKKWRTPYVKMLWFYAVFILLHNFFYRIGFYSTDALYVGKHIYPLVTWLDWVKQVGWALLAAREPFLGAMWFINLMFLGMCFISLTVWLVNRLPIRTEYRLWACGAGVVAMAMVASVSTHVFDVNITRLSPALVGTVLIYMGYVLNRRLCIEYNNPWVFAISIMVMYELACLFGEVSIAGGVYKDIVILIVGTVASLYVLAFIAKKIECSIFGNIIAYCGRESFFIMALHLVGFKVATLLLNVFGGNKNLDELFSQADTFWEWILYTTCGVVFALAVAKAMDWMKNLKEKIVPFCRRTRDV